jgi:tryptophanyl-tRNA synthetase
MKRVLSGIQPSGEVHLGNYLGAIKHWVDRQAECDSLVMVADLHAITLPQDPAELRQRTLDLTRLLLACGLDPEKTVLFKQSDVAAHSELAWILNCIAHMGELNRMVQFKDKSQTSSERSSVGLFDYPVLQAADILLYDTEEVPIGEDQQQHLELTRDLAQRFNKRFGPTFKVPEPKIETDVTSRVKSLSDSSRKMSKSDAPASYLGLLDKPEVAERKIRKAVTDQGGVANLSGILAALDPSATGDWAGDSLGLKEALGQAMVGLLRQIQSRYADIQASEAQRMLADGRDRAAKLANRKLAEVKQVVGLA